MKSCFTSEEVYRAIQKTESYGCPPAPRIGESISDWRQSLESGDMVTAAIWLCEGSDDKAEIADWFDTAIDFLCRMKTELTLSEVGVK